MAEEDFNLWPRSKSTRHQDNQVYRASKSKDDDDVYKLMREITIRDDSDQDLWPVSNSHRKRRSKPPAYHVVTEFPRTTKDRETEVWQDGIYVPSGGKTIIRRRASRAHSQSPNLDIWLGRTRSQVKRDNARIGELQSMPAPPEEPKFHEVCKSLVDMIWVKDSDGWSLRPFGEVRELEGKWQPRADAPDHPYFVVEAKKR